MADRNEYPPCTYSELTEYEKGEVRLRGFPRGPNVRYVTKRKYSEEARDWALVRYIREA